MNDSAASDHGGSPIKGVRVVWREGPYRLECAGRADALRLRIYAEDRLVAEEIVASAEAGYRRGREICERLPRSEPRGYGKSSG